MKSPYKSLPLIVTWLSVVATTGCQRSMNGSMATGPFAPAGSMAPNSSAPLIPIGPVSGATRVPPPATGSSSPNNAYLSTPTTSSIDGQSGNSLAANTINSGNVAPNFKGANANGAGTPSNNFRDSLGGMPTHDLTVQSPANQAVPATYGVPYPTSAVGSGLNPQFVAAPGANWAPQPSDLLRPIETPTNAVPVPRYRGIESSQQAFNTAMPPSTGFATTDSWQTIAPVSAGMTASQTEIRQTSTVSSPAPLGNGNPTVQTASPSLPWRSPTTAR